MKTSIILTVLILALGALPAVFRQQRLAALREDRQDLTKEALKLGLPVDASDGAEPRITKRQRADLERHARTTAAELIEFATELEAMEKSGGEADAEFKKRTMEMMAKMMELDPSQMKLVIAALRENQSISAEIRGNFISFSILAMSNEHPEKAVALLAESSGMLDKSLLGDHVITTALASWAKTDANAALKWIENHAASHPELAGDDARCGVIAGAAATDPKAAFKLLAESKLKDPMSAIHAIVMTGHENPAQRDAVLDALREHLGGITNETERDEIRAKALEIFARTSDKEGYESLTSWIADAEFTPQEKDDFAGGLSYFTTKGETGKWVEWIAQNLPPDAQAESVRELIGEWTQQDYVAAGKWLSESPESSAKPAAVAAYAEAVAEYEPQVAVQWALTMPPGQQRETTLKAIYQNWPAGDPEGAAKFAREHGLE